MYETAQTDFLTTTLAEKAQDIDVRQNRHGRNFFNDWTTEIQIYSTHIEVR